MATEIMQLTWCDKHLREHGEKLDGTPRGPLQVGNLKGVELDLCDECDTLLLAPVRELARAMGRKESGRPLTLKDEQRPFGCLLCTKTYNNSTTASSHLNEQHGIGVDELCGRECPLCGFHSKAYRVWVRTLKGSMPKLV